MNNCKKLDSWWVRQSDDPYLAPELRSVKLSGKVFNHPRHPDRDTVSTSRAVAFDPIRQIFKTYSGSYYTLGEPDTEYESSYPDARNRMIAQLEKLPAIAVVDDMMVEMHEKDREALECV